MLEEFRQVPEEWKPIASDRIRAFVRLSILAPYRLIPHPITTPANRQDPNEDD